MQHQNNVHHNSQVSEAYSMKGSIAGGKPKPNPNLNKSNYASNHSPSPSQTFFKGKQ
jgi:hypothetical protein